MPAQPAALQTPPAPPSRAWEPCLLDRDARIEGTGVQGSRIHGNAENKNRGIQGNRDAETEDTGMQGYRYGEIKDTETEGYRDAGTQGCRD